MPFPAARSWLVAALAAAAVLSGGCGGGDAAPQPPPAQADTDGDGVPDREDAAPEDAAIGRETRVTAELSLERAPSGPPDAGTQTGHRGGEAMLKSARPVASFDGVARPAQAVITATADPGLRVHVRPDGDHGDFTVTVRGLRRGRNELILRGRAEGYASWRQTVVVTRR